MNRLARPILVVLAGLLAWPMALTEQAGAWGFYGHRRINRMACFTLPPEMFGFYKKHIDFITDYGRTIVAQKHNHRQIGCQQPAI